MINKTKIIANYLPQYHVTPENNKWWGDGFTDWESVKKAKSLYKGHQQPKKPLNGRYYSLDQADEIKWQASIARKYGIYGFGIYHYWFSSNLNLLHTPGEIILDNKDIDINFLFLWDNCTWKRTWSNVRHANDWAPDCDDQQGSNKQSENGDSGILAKLEYGNEEDWKLHFDYMLPFFKDSRYIKIDNKPVFGFFQPQNDFETIKHMALLWEKLSVDNGFSGIICMTRDNYLNINLSEKFRYSPLVPVDFISYFKYKVKDIWSCRFKRLRFYDYDKCWNQIIKEAERSDAHTILSGFVQFDDTPRRGKNGRIVLGSSPQKFQKYMAKLLMISQTQSKEYVFLSAWNEWGEGMYLEPDTINGYGYLEALKKAIDESKSL